MNKIHLKNNFLEKLFLETIVIYLVIQNKHVFTPHLFLTEWDFSFENMYFMKLFMYT